jgi:glutamate-1-semialdehyde 2,1-aminomutase
MTTTAASVDRYARSRELGERLHELVPGGGHTYSKGDDQFPARSPRVIARAEGAYCFDVDGNRFLDWAMGNRVIVLGHGHPAVNEAVKRQIDLGLNFTRPGILELELAEQLTELWPVAEMVKFGKNGSDVTTAAVKLARAATGRRYVAYCRNHPFFSIHDWFIGTTPASSGVLPEAYASTLSFPYNDLDALRELFDAHPGEIAALILEPVKNDEPKPGYLEGLRELTRREGTVLIFDEMISGIRFDLRGAHHRLGVLPDLATFGKAIGNGYAVSVLAGRREIMELGGIRHDRERVFLLSQTHGSETVGLAACAATLAECERVDVTSHIWELGGRLVAGVRRIAAEEGVEAHLRMIGFDCNPQLQCTRADGTYWPELHTSFHEEVIARGVLMPWTSVTLAHGDEELELTFEAVRAGARKIAAAIEGGTVDESFEGPAVLPVFRRYNDPAREA